jgi:hypothetical protein
MSNKAIDNSQNKASLIMLVAAFSAVYVIWGSTYLAIKYAIETIPTFRGPHREVSFRRAAARSPL